MKCYAPILRHTFGVGLGAALFWLLIVLWYGLTEAGALPSAAVWCIGMACANFMVGSGKWEQTMRTMPIDMKKLILARFLLAAAAALLAAILYILGSLFGRNEHILGESMGICGCVLLIAAGAFAIYYGVPDGLKRTVTGGVYGMISYMICTKLLEYRYFHFVSDERGNFIAVNHPLPVWKGALTLAIAVAGAVVLYFSAVRLEAERDW